MKTQLNQFLKSLLSESSIRQLLPLGKCYPSTKIKSTLASFPWFLVLPLALPLLNSRETHYHLAPQERDSKVSKYTSIYADHLPQFSAVGTQRLKLITANTDGTPQKVLNSKPLKMNPFAGPFKALHKHSEDALTECTCFDCGAQSTTLAPLLNSHKEVPKYGPQICMFLQADSPTGNSDRFPLDHWPDIC